MDYQDLCCQIVVTITSLLYNTRPHFASPIYKNIYTDGNVSYELYVPVFYENITLDHGSIAHDIANARVEAPIYYLNLEKTEYAIGYDSVESLYDNLLKNYENDYTITKK